MEITVSSSEDYCEPHDDSICVKQESFVFNNASEQGDSWKKITGEMTNIANDKSIFTFGRLLRRICAAKQHIHLQIRAHPAGGFIVSGKRILSLTIIRMWILI